MNRAMMGHAATVLLRQIGNLVRIEPDDREKPILIVEEARTIDWASLTFVGQRHVLDLRIEGEVADVAAALAQVEAGLADTEFSITGHFLADIMAVPGSRQETRRGGHVAQRLRVEALVLKD